jgi:hypothetical protein
VGQNMWFRPQNYDSTFELGDILSSLEAALDGDKDAALQLISKYANPFLIGGPEQITNKDFFSGDDIYDAYSAGSTPQFWLDQGWNDETFIRGKHALGGMFRAINEFERAQRALSDGVDVLDVLKLGFGIPIYESGTLENAVHYGLIENERKLQEHDVRFNFDRVNVYFVPPERIDNVANLLWDRLVLDFKHDEYLHLDPRTGVVRPYTAEGAKGGIIGSQSDVIQAMQADIRALIELQDKYEGYQNGDVNGKRMIQGMPPPVSPEQMTFLDNMNQSLMFTRIALLMAAVEAQELTAEQAAQKIQDRWAAQPNSFIAPQPYD